MSPNRIFKTGRWSLAALIAASLVFALPAPATTIDMVATVNFDAVQTLGGSTCPGPGTYTFTASWDDTATDCGARNRRSRPTTRRSLSPAAIPAPASASGTPPRASSRSVQISSPRPPFSRAPG